MDSAGSLFRSYANSRVVTADKDATDRPLADLFRNIYSESDLSISVNKRG